MKSNYHVQKDILWCDEYYSEYTLTMAENLIVNFSYEESFSIIIIIQKP